MEPPRASAAAIRSPATSAASQTSKCQRMCEADLAADIRDAGETRVSGAQRAAEGFSRGKVGRVGAGDVAPQLLHAGQERSGSDKLDRGGHHR